LLYLVGSKTESNGSLVTLKARIVGLDEPFAPSLSKEPKEKMVYIVSDIFLG